MAAKALPEVRTHRHSAQSLARSAQMSYWLSDFESGRSRGWAKRIYPLNMRVPNQAHPGCNVIDSECPLFIDKLGLSLKACCPKTPDIEFRRVVTIAGRPEFVSALELVNIARLLQVRQGDEARVFRQ